MGIEELISGEMVFSKKENTGKIDLQKNLKVTPGQSIIKVERIGIGNEDNLFVTAEYPFWLKDKGWVNAKSLKTGDEILTLNGNSIIYHRYNQVR